MKRESLSHINDKPSQKTDFHEKKMTQNKEVRQIEQKSNELWPKGHCIQKQTLPK